MKKLLSLSTIALIAILWVSSAHAGLMFGKNEHIRYVASTTIQGPAGERLYLARKVTMHDFLLPYSVQDEGFVLGVSGDPKKYYPFPEASKLELLQATGQLPKPLPAWELALFDQLMGHALWLFIIGITGYASIKKFLKKQ